MSAPSDAASDRGQEGPCARCIIGALVGTVVAVAMVFVTARVVSALLRGGLRRSSG